MTDSNLNTRRRGLIARRRFLEGAGLFGLGLAVSVACGGGGEGPLTTLDDTIVLDPDGNLVLGPGEPYAVRTELAQAQTGRDAARRSLAVFHHFSDFRITDEESPLRSEWVESCPEPLSTSAFRPQESLSLQAAAAMIEQANRIDRSPVTGRPVDFAVHTGNEADNAQFNEVRWFLDLLDGKAVTPSSGSPEYQGVQDKSPAGAYPDLLADAQREFRPQALRYPWFAAAGNRDLLALGNVAPTETAGTAVTGSDKIISIGPAAKEEVCADPSLLLAPGSPERILDDPDTVVVTAVPDVRRRLLTRKEWVEEHFQTAEGPGPVGHGFSPENRDQGTAYYVLDRGPVVFIVLDTVNPGGFSAGSMDIAQFIWLEQQLAARSSAYFDAVGKPATTENADRLLVIASHHASDTMNNPFPDPATQEDRVRGPQLEAMLHRFPNVVLHVAGHALEHRITARPDPSRRTAGYWEVTTASPLDYPMQSRLLEIADNGDGTLSLFSTVYDTAAPINPGDAKDPTPDDGVNQLRQASVARQVGVRDPQVNLAAAGPAPGDRNAELLLPAPFDLSKLQAERRTTRRGLLRAFVPLPPSVWRLTPS